MLRFRVPSFTICGVDRERVNSSTRYRHEASAECLYQVGLFTSTLSHLYHVSPSKYLYIYHIDFEIVISHFRMPSVMMIILFLLKNESICSMSHVISRTYNDYEGEVESEGVVLTVDIHP